MKKLLLLATALLTLTQCATNPVTGGSVFTGGMGVAQENQIGAQQHGQILQQFNGQVDNDRLQAWVETIGNRLKPYAERQEVNFTFTVLNDDMVNAFAVPGGYIYVTRGLINLAQNEAQVAAVLGHEMGHINALHSNQQNGQTMIANIGLGVLGAATGSNVAGQLGSLGADAVLKGYSRTHEFQADELGVKYLAKAGYDPRAAGDFLAMLQKHSQFEAALAGNKNMGDQFSIFSTHPATAERVPRAYQLADATGTKGGSIGRDSYLSAVDGTIYGDVPEQGFVRGRDFVHPKLGFRFTVPAGFRITNTPTKIVAENLEGSKILFDMGTGPANIAPDQYLKSIWAPQAQLAGLQMLNDVNGQKGATATTQMQGSGNTYDARLVAIAGGGTDYYRFTFLTPASQTKAMEEPFRVTTYSLRGLSAAEKKLATPNRVRIVRVNSGDTVQSLAEKMPVSDHAAERFCLLNGCSVTDRLTVGNKVKIVATF